METITQSIDGSPHYLHDDELTAAEATLNAIRDIENRSLEIIDRLREDVFAPDKRKRLELRFTISQAAEMAGRTPTAIRDAEAKGKLPSPEVDENGRRTGYRLEDVNQMRTYFGTLPWRRDDEEPLVIAVQNFKGGVGKSTTTTHMAQYLALRGYRVCVIDCDPQASSTTIFGINPDMELTNESTLGPFLGLETESLHSVISDTYWPQLKLIPSNLLLNDTEYTLGMAVAGNPHMLQRLRSGVDGIKDQFDVVLLDPPPALGMLSLSVLRAANALIIPVRPATPDFSSTTAYFTMLRENLEIMLNHGLPVSFKFIKILVNDMSESKSAHVQISKMMAQLYGTHRFSTVLKDSAEIDNAAGRMMTVYELDKPLTSRDTHQRCKVYLDGVGRELETLIRQTWPSHRESLRREGLI